MAQGNKTMTNVTLVKETPAAMTLVAAEADGYISDTDISFNFVDGLCEINAAANDFAAAGFEAAEEDQRILVETTSGLNDGLYTMVTAAAGKLTLTALDVVTTETAAAAGTVVITGVEVYVITPTKATGKLCLVIYEGSGLAGLRVSFISGSFWASQNTELTTLATTVTISKVNYLFIETAPYMCADGKIYLVLRPVAGSQLTTSHAPTAGFLELP